MDTKKRIELVERNTKEIIGKDKLASIFRNKRVVSYWGVAPTGPPHIGYYRTIAKQRDLVEAGCQHKILIANLHAYLDDQKSPWEDLELRSKIYKKCFELLGLKGNKIEYIIGTDFQLSRNFVLELFKASALVTVNRATRSASEVVRMKNPKVSSLIYPIMQAMDCWGLDVDIAYSGIDNRHVYALAGEILSKLNRKVPVFVFTPLGISLSGKEKMSASEKTTRLELYSTPQQIKEKINKAYCPVGVVENNPILDYAKYFIFPYIKKFKVERPSKFGGDITFISAEQIEQYFKNKELHPLDLKKSVSQYLIEILKPIREYFDENKDLLKTFSKE